MYKFRIFNFSISCFNQRVYHLIRVKESKMVIYRIMALITKEFDFEIVINNIVKYLMQRTIKNSNIVKTNQINYKCPGYRS